MAGAAVEIREFDPKNASEQEYAALNAHGNRMRAESWPEDPPIGLAETIRGLRSIPPFFDLHFWTIWREDGSGIVAAGNAGISRTEDNRHMANFGISVLPEMRRQGLGRRLLARVVDVARKENR